MLVKYATAMLNSDMVRFALFLAVLFSLSAPRITWSQSTELPPTREEPTVRAELESVYQKYRNAMLAKNLSAWEEHVAMYRRMETRNRIVSEKQPFPEALFEGPIQPPSLKGLIFLNVLARRDTASAIYFGKVDYGIPGAEVSNTLLVLRFLKEEGAWRFDNTRIVRIGNNAEVLHQIRQADLTFLKADEFQPLDKIPMIAQPVTTPELMAEIWVRSIGFASEIWINGHRTGEIQNNQGKELIMGGIRKGNNTITIRTRKIPSGKFKPRFEIAIYAAGAHGEKADKVFQFGPREELPSSVSMGFSGKPLKK